MGKYTLTKLTNIWIYHTGADPEETKLFIDEEFGRQIHWNQYGTQTAQGWNIHHLDEEPSNNEIENLRPIHWKSHKELHEID